MIKIDILSDHDVYSLNSNKNDLFNRISPIANLTDYAYFSINNANILNKGKWWLKSGDGDGNVDVVGEDGKGQLYEADNPCIGTRPVMKYEDVKDSITDIKMNEYGVLEGEYGEYIQRLVTKDEQIELESIFCNNEINFTEKYYNVIMPNNYTLFEKLELKYFPEYIYDNKKFVRVETKNKIYWFEVLPIKWVISPNDNMIISKDIIIGRMPMQINDEYYLLNMFDYTDLYKYLNNIFRKEMVPSQINNKVLKK